jgi:luciferase family oxidoreductase group 1
LASKPLLSVLDLSPIRAGGTGAEAVRETLDVAEAAERLGYHRFWLAEHHATANLASPCPEILIAAIAQRTSRIRVGSGGVMLVNHSPLKVAEQFMELEALAPGRIDLGLGRALGADLRTGGALRSAGSEAFPRYFALLTAWLLDASGSEPMGDDHPAKGIFAQPGGPTHPDVFLLCTSEDSARFAGMAGVGMVFAEFIARRPATSAIAAYRQAFEPSAFRQTPWAGAGITALAADTEAEALRLDAPRRAFARALGQGRRPGPLDVEAALAELGPLGERLSPEDLAIVGDGAAVRAGLNAKAAEIGADELFITGFAPTLEARIRSLELMASPL